MSLGIEKGKTIIGAAFGITPNPNDKTFKVKLTVTLPRHQLLEIYVTVNSVKQISDMVKRYEQDGWKPAEDKEEEDAKFYRFYR